MTEAERFINSSKPFLKEWISDCCMTCETDELLRYKLQGIGISVPEGQNICIAVDFDKKSVVDDSKQFEHFIEINKILSKYKCKCLPFFDVYTFCYLIICEKNKNIMEVAYACAENIRSYLEEQYIYQYGIGVSNKFTNLKQFSVSCKLAVEASKYRYSRGDAQIIFIGDIESHGKITEQYLMRQDDIITAIKVGSESMMEETVNSIFFEMKDNDEPLTLVKRITLELMICSARAIYEVGQNPGMLFEKTDIWSVINRCDSAEQLCQLIVNANKVVISQMFRSHTSKNAKLIEKVKKIIEENSSGKITLENVASQIFVSPSYLSIVFSKEMGITFKEFLIKSRLQKAKELLGNPNYKIYEVAKMVGYSDARYFSDLFRKYEKVTPVEYRKNL